MPDPKPVSIPTIAEIPRNTSDDELQTLEELALKLKVKKSWIYAKTRETGASSMPRVKLGKYLRFRLSDVLAWIEQHQGDWA